MLTFFNFVMQLGNNVSRNNGRNPLIQSLELRYGPLIARCQESSNLCLQLNLTGELPIQFPRIIVVGCESAGKSSIIEGLAGFRFFPIGHEITTRMPIVMSLRLTSREDCIELCNNHNLNYDPNSGNPIIARQQNSIRGQEG